MSNNQSYSLVLGSASPARKYLLEREGYQFTVLPANIVEPMDEEYANPRELVQHISWLKAQAVAPQVEEGILLAADTVAWIDGEAIGKPADEADARRILRLLGGREHELWTGVVLWRRPDNVQLIWQEQSICVLKAMGPEEENTYLKSREWANNSGGYAIKETNDPYVTITSGAQSNVIGLPMETLKERLPLLI